MNTPQSREQQLRLTCYESPGFAAVKHSGLAPSALSKKEQHCTHLLRLLA
jgi:hypothetical protein